MIIGKDKLKEGMVVRFIVDNSPIPDIIKSKVSSSTAVVVDRRGTLLLLFNHHIADFTWDCNGLLNNQNGRYPTGHDEYEIITNNKIDAYLKKICIKK